jgi:hypothetical protein
MDSLFEQIALNAIAERSPRGAILPETVRPPPWDAPQPRAPVGPPPSGPPPPGWRPGHGAGGGGEGGASDDEAGAPPLPCGVDADEDDTDADGFVVFSTRRVRAAFGCLARRCAHGAHGRIRVCFRRAQFPNLQAMANCGSLPLGAVFEPFAPCAPPPPRLRREPVRCQICGAFANRFCPVDAGNGRWVCVFCGASSFCRDYVGLDRVVRPSRGVALFATPCSQP